MYHLICSEIDAAIDWYQRDIELRQPNAARDCLCRIPQTPARQSTLAQAGENDESAGDGLTCALRLAASMSVTTCWTPLVADSAWGEVHRASDTRSAVVA